MNTYLQKLAVLMCDYSLGIKKNDLVMIQAEEVASPLIKICYEEILKRGAHPLVRMTFSGQNASLFKYGQDHQFTYVPEVDRLQAETINARIYIDATDNSKQLTGADSASVAKVQKVRGDLREIMMQREEKGEYSWVICPYPTSAMAQDAEMSFDDYADFVYKALKLESNDPVAAWQEVDRIQTAIVERLTGTSHLHILGEKTDFRLNVSGRRWKSCAGQRNLPDGEVFTSPVEDSAEGQIFFDLPTNYNGVEAKGILLKFEKGKVVEAHAEKGEDFLLKMLNTDEGARFVGEIAFGLNENITKPSKNILFDEKIGSTMHMAVGASYPETGGLNKSALHWDLIKSMSKGEVQVDGKVVYKDGKFI